MEKDLKRKLAALLVADVVGYSRLISDDEEATLRRLEVFRAIWQDCVVKYSGRIFNTAGDSVLAEFQSAVEAVRCALDFQAQAKAHNDGLVPNRQMHFRVGITIGDVVERGSDLLGDGVNIAARLQALAGQGGICVSSWVREAVANKLGVKFIDLGDQSVKNIPTPIRAYSVSTADTAPLAPGDSPAMKDWLGRAVSSWPAMGTILGLAAVGVFGAFWLASNFGSLQKAEPRIPLAGPPNTDVRDVLKKIDTSSTPPRPSGKGSDGPERSKTAAAPPDTGKGTTTAPAVTPPPGKPAEPPVKMAAPAPTPPPAVSPPPANAAPSPPSSQVRMGLLTEAAERNLKPGDRFKECDTCPEMVVIPRGDFIMGSTAGQPGHESDEAPARRIAIGARIAVARYSVSVSEYDTFVTVTGYRPGAGCRTYEGGRWVELPELSFRNPGFKQTGDHPVVCVNWNDAKGYTAWMSARLGGEYRLPSEAEREYATRAGTSTAFWWGNNIAPSQAAYDWSLAFATGPRGAALTGTVPVASFEANPWGLYQMHGNVSEWVEDCWNDSYRSAPVDSSAWQSGDCRLRVLRGGSWGYAPKDLRSAYREGATLSFRNFNFGFRVVRVLRDAK